jgi:hypothetical protein
MYSKEQKVAEQKVRLDFSKIVVQKGGFEFLTILF